MWSGTERDAGIDVKLTMWFVWPIKLCTHMTSLVPVLKLH